MPPRNHFAALAATHSDEHDFLTRVQIVWSALMENRHHLEALRCLLDVQPRAHGATWRSCQN